MKIQEARDVLNRLSPDELNGWWTSCAQQILVQSAALKVSVFIDVQELDGLSDGKIKKLIRNRSISALEDKLATLQDKSFINR